MPIITTRISGSVKNHKGEEVKSLNPSESLAIRGPIIQGTLTFSDAQQKASAASDNPEESAKSQSGFIMLDTGASHTCFDIKAATDLGLVITGRMSMSSASHANHIAPLYSGKLIFGGMNIDVSGGGASLSSQGLIALIGRDILRLGILFYHGADGSVSFAIA